MCYQKWENIAKLQTFDLNYFWGKIHFEDDRTQNYLVFHSVYWYFKKICNSNHISA